MLISAPFNKSVKLGWTLFKIFQKSIESSLIILIWFFTFSWYNFRLDWKGNIIKLTIKRKYGSVNIMCFLFWIWYVAPFHFEVHLNAFLVLPISLLCDHIDQDFVGVQDDKDKQIKQRMEKRIITNFHYSWNDYKMIAHTLQKKGINNAHITHLLKYKWDFRRNTKIPSNKFCQQLSKNELILTPFLNSYST